MSTEKRERESDRREGEEREIERESDIRPRFTQKVSKRHVNRLADPTARVHPSK